MIVLNIGVFLLIIIIAFGIGWLLGLMLNLKNLKKAR